jgi:virulence-associated protein VapD
LDKSVRKVINFDLDTKKLDRYYSSTAKSGNNGYSDIRCFLEENGFEHRQYSTYSSYNKLYNRNIFKLIEKLDEKFPWIDKCVNKMDVTDIGEMYGLTDIFDKDKKCSMSDIVREPLSPYFMRRYNLRLLLGIQNQAIM